MASAAASPPIQNPNQDKYLITGIAERKYLTANAEYSDHAPIVYDLSPINPFIKIITWNVANFGDNAFPDSSGKIVYNHKFSITNNANFPNGKETENHYNARLERIAKAISDLFENNKPLADKCDPVFMCQELPSMIEPNKNLKIYTNPHYGTANLERDTIKYNQINTFKTKLNEELKKHKLRLLNLPANKSHYPECNMIIREGNPTRQGDNIEQGILVIGKEKLNWNTINDYLPNKLNPVPQIDKTTNIDAIFEGPENKANRTFINNLLYRSGYSYKIYFEKYLVIFVSVHTQLPIVCDNLITAMVATLIDQIDSIMAAKTTKPKYESLLSIIFAGDFNRSLAPEKEQFTQFTQLKQYLTRNNIKASLNRYSAKPITEGGTDYKTSFGDNKGGYNADNVDCVLEVKFDPPRAKTN